MLNRHSYQRQFFYKFLVMTLISHDVDVRVTTHLPLGGILSRIAPHSKVARPTSSLARHFPAEVVRAQMAKSSTGPRAASNRSSVSLCCIHSPVSNPAWHALALSRIPFTCKFTRNPL